MNVDFEPRGAWTALATPFHRDGTLDRDCFHTLIEFQIEEGITGIVPCGTTGESPTLTWHEHDEIVGAALKAANGRVGVLAGTGSNNTAEAVRGTRDAKERGASAALLVDCYYNGPSSLELRTEYYERVLEEVPEIPIVPYIIPGRSGCELSAVDLAWLHNSDPARVPAVKQATGDLDRMRRDRELCGDGMAILSGDDDMTLSMMADPGIRCTGVISVMSNLAPAAIANMVAAQASGDVRRAGEIAGKLGPLLRLVGVKVPNRRTLPDGCTLDVQDNFRNPVPLKTMMAGLGMIEPVWRRPLGRMTANAVDIARKALRQVQESAPEVLAPIEAAFDVKIESRLNDDSAWAAVTA